MPRDTELPVLAPLHRPIRAAASTLTFGKSHLIDTADQDAQLVELGDAICQTCGACCTYGGEVIVPHGDPDVPHAMRRSVRDQAGFASWEHEFHSAMARRKDGACVAFAGVVGEACGCGIYSSRPDGCRYFESGSEECRLARQAAGLAAIAQPRL